MTLEEAVRLLMPSGELGDEVHAEILACAKKGLIRIEEDGTLVLTEDGKRRAEQLEENVKTATAEDAIKPESQPTRMTTVEFDLHGYYPGDIYNGLLTRIVQQAWEMGASDLVLIHGHGGKSCSVADGIRVVSTYSCTSEYVRVRVIMPSASNCSAAMSISI
jgi:hypothetical protein